MQKKSNRSSNHNLVMTAEKSRGMEQSQLMKLFEDELKDIYWAEKALVKAIPKMAKKATNEELIEGLEKHLQETENQVARVEQVFELIGKKAVSKKCMAMDGLISEHTVPVAIRPLGT